MNQRNAGRSTAYEWKAVSALALGFGLVGLDRWLVAPLIPSIARDLHLSGQDVGNVLGILGLSWGVFAVFVGNLTDQIGRRAVVIPSLIIFSVMCGLTGMVSSVGGLLLIRGRAQCGSAVSACRCLLPSGQWRAMPDGIDGIPGNHGNVESVT